ncbi:MAG: cytochrome c oxidase subunit II [Gammaproteobacteria bacterium]|nr:cytochrome c oxidase subunit II [Gammaproteobacteria bacterium]
MSLFRKIAVAVAALSVLVLMGCSEQAYNMREGVTDISKEVFELHMIAFWVCVAIGIVTFGAMFYSMWAHRKSKNPNPAKFSHSTTVELIWTIIPFIILIALAWPAAKLLNRMEVAEGDDFDMEIMVKGYRWYWGYEYLDNDDNLRNDVKFFSNLDEKSRELSLESQKMTFSAEKITDPNFLLEVDNPLVIPVNKKVKFLVTAEDVIHSFWVPDFSVKKDAVPGIINDVWTIVPETGIYRGVCAELCGELHGFMPIVVKVVEQAEFDEWYAAKVAEAEAGPDLNERSLAQLMAEGEKAYNTSCAACHGADGTGGVGPSFIGSDLIKGDIAKHIDIVVNGQATMPAFGKVLTPAEIAAIITYERNAWGNDTGDKVQPQEIQDLLNGGGE